eukprot:c14832_g1_i1 orf=97-531(+)
MIESGVKLFWRCHSPPVKSMRLLRSVEASRPRQTEVQVEHKNARTSSYQEGQVSDALDQLDRGVIPGDFVTYSALLQACRKAGSVCEGKRVHGHIIRSGLDRDIFLGNQLISMYGNCGSVEDARRAFDKLPQQNVVSWTAMIAA